MKKLYLMVGEPGSGKSTFLKNYQKKVGGVIVSRDEIRFGLLGKNDSYFSKENTVFDKYIESIQNALKNNEIVFADATHISEGSRMKVLNRLDLTDVEVRPIVIETSLTTCLANNSTREGLQRVPDQVIKRMFNQFKHPIYDKFHYKEVLTYFYNTGELTPCQLAKSG